MRKPIDVAYGIDDLPPFGVTVFSAIQHCAILIFTMVTTLLICQAAHASLSKTVNTISLGLLVSGIGTIVQASRSRPRGSGYLLPNGSQAVYLGPSLAAGHAGGLSLVFGMTMFSGAVEVMVSRA